MAVGFYRRSGTTLWWQVGFDSMFSQHGNHGIPHSIVEIVGCATMEVGHGRTRLALRLRNQLGIAVSEMALRESRQHQLRRQSRCLGKPAHEWFRQMIDEPPH